MSATWSDEDSEGESEEEIANSMTMFTRKWESTSESSDEDISYEELA